MKSFVINEIKIIQKCNYVGSRVAPPQRRCVGAMLDNIASVTNSVFVGTVITADLLDNIWDQIINITIIVCGKKLRRRVLFKVFLHKDRRLFAVVIYYKQRKHVRNT